jgi:hypothetical protein
MKNRLELLLLKWFEQKSYNEWNYMLAWRHECKKSNEHEKKNRIKCDYQSLKS